MGGPRAAFLQGKLGSLQLSEAEKKGVRITGKQQQQPCPSPPASGKIQAVGKLLWERPAIAHHVETSLGAVWSPHFGVQCKDLGRNRFLFTFHQEADKERALDAGPWSFAGHLLVMEDFAAEAATVDERRFDTVPIWVRAYGVPAGSMSRETGELVGGQVGKVLEVDTGANADSTGAFMRIKVRMDITVPIMRFVTCFIQDEEEDMTTLGDGEKEEKIVAFTYENIPDFCYGCGIIGHTQKSCPTRSTRTGPRQFGPWLRTVVINKVASSEERPRCSKDKAKFWPSTSIDSKQGSDGPSWRKEIPSTEDDEGVQNKAENRVYKAVKSSKQGTFKRIERKKGIQQNQSNMTQSKNRRADIMNVDEVIQVANKAKMKTDGGEENANSEMLDAGLLGQPGESK